MHTPLKFPNSAEGKRLLQAREECRRVTKQVEQLTKEIRANAKGPIVYPLYANESYVKASKEFESATRAYYMATGDESQLWFPPLPPQRWNEFQKSVETHFGKIARDLNSELVRILPWIYGFATAHAVVILKVVDVDRGDLHVFVTLRPRKPDEKIEFSNEELGHEVGNSVGLGSIVGFQNPNGWKPNPGGISDKALKYHAEILLEYGKNFLTDPNANWDGLREMEWQEREKLLAEKPWLKKYSLPQR
jgi:hypothetical protein